MPGDNINQGCMERAVSGAVGGALIGGVMGAVAAAFRQGATGDLAAASPLSKIGSHSAVMAGVGGAFLMGECMAEGVRGQRDWVNSVYGGFLAGQVMGVAKRSWYIAAGAGVGMAIVGATVEATGGIESRSARDWNKLQPKYSGAEQ